MEITIEVNVSPHQETTYRNKEGEATQLQRRELTVDEWELHFRNERLAAERVQELINDGEKHGNTSCDVQNCPSLISNSLKRRKSTSDERHDMYRRMFL